MVAEYALFETRIGPLGIVWSAVGVAGVQLPERNGFATATRLCERFPGAARAEPPPAIEAATGAIASLLSGHEAELSSIVLDTSAVGSFPRRVYEAARRIERGRTITYGELARIIGVPGAARAVGTALGKNPFPLIVPCHRVLGADGKLGGFTAPGGTATKRLLLSIEGVATAVSRQLELLS